MEDDLTARAEARLESALENDGVRDPRPGYRTLLKRLRQQDPDAFSASIRYFEEELLPAVAGDADPLKAWLAYGQRLARALAPGRLMEVGPSGRAHAVEEAPEARALLLYLPDEDTLPAIVLRYPRPSTRAQDATVELLVEGRQNASAYGRR